MHPGCRCGGTPQGAPGRAVPVTRMQLSPRGIGRGGEILHSGVTYTGGMTFRRALLLGLVLMALAPRAQAQGFETVGLRALGMGGAFVGVADDASATFWNPAGLVTGPLFTLVAETGVGGYDDAPVPGRPGVTSSIRQGGTLIALGTWPLGATFYRLPGSAARVVRPGPAPSGDPAATLSRLTTTHVGVNVLQTLVSGVHVGAALKYVHGSAASERVAPSPADPLDAAGNLATRGSSRFDVDAGIIADLPRLRLGLTVRNLLEPEFDTPGDVRLALPRQVRAGVSVRPTSTLTLSLDSDLTTLDDPAGERRSLAAGAEQRFWQERAAVRGGFRLSTVGDTRPVATAGGSISLRSGLFADGYVAIGLDEAATDAFGVGLRVSF